jgi:hypothetical protein
VYSLRRVTRRLPIVLGVFVLGVLAYPAASSAQPLPQDSVTGSGTADFYGQFDIQAQSGPSGESPTGQVTANGAVFFSGPVTCLAVSGNVATMNIQTPQFGVITMTVTDNATSGVADVIDAIPTGRVPTDCSPFSGGVVGNVLTGDIVVVDASPFPISKDQCKQGGWRTLTDDAGQPFKNQGQCVSFVVHASRGT